MKAKAASANMYSASDASVTSSLIDSYAWDTVTQWLSNSGYNVTNSTDWGNYMNASFNVTGLYAKHQWRNRCYPAYTWSYGSYSKSSNEYTEVSTGSIERNKAKNIYDFAGNMWEMTTEVCTAPSAEDSTIVAVRGGSWLMDYGEAHPASQRNGSRWCLLKNNHPDVGFRVVLYIK